jgi:transcription initiation factor TFIIIB Brf1 subunit/transcription initiation factor TFIIB
MRLHNRQSVSDRAMQQATREINEYCERLRLVDTIRSHALEIFKDVSS